MCGSTEITLPSGLVLRGDQCFAGCAGLTGIALPGAGGLVSLSDNVDSGPLVNPLAGG